MSLILAENISKDYQVVATKVSKDYGGGEVVVRALRGVSFEIEPASFVSFVGPSGSGKTTLLNLIGCLDKPTEGNLTVVGTDVLKLDRHESAQFRGDNLGFIFQDFNLIPVLTVYENIEYPLIIVKNIAAGERRKRVMAVLEAVGMADQNVARARVSDPKLVLADEPTANLDSKTAYTIINLMKKMRDELKSTFIFSTHDQRIVGEAEILYSLADGELVGKQVKGGRENG
ncbi:MAG: ABC transporter [Deltaproteobacteria bacterium SM23_61]|nr:MAG: ABC transporter [Deltaproteobacteria bacterium SM23_61]